MSKTFIAVVQNILWVEGFLLPVFGMFVGFDAKYKDYAESYILGKDLLCFDLNMKIMTHDKHSWNYKDKQSKINQEK